MFSKNERTVISSLATILAFRMLGLFIIIPVFSPYLQNLNDATPLLIGITVGVYGLTQAIFQLPFGILSDYIGRREVITLGLVLFLLGSVVAGMSTSIWGMLLGRALQGAGAISGTIMALLSDSTSEDNRTKAMAIIGVSIGAAFILAFMLGPMLTAFLSVSKVFYLTAILVVPILYILWYLVPEVSLAAGDKSKTLLPKISLHKTQLRHLQLHCFGIFTLHGILMANFVAVPIILKQIGLNNFEQGTAYIKIFILAVVFMLPLLFWSEKKRQQTKVMTVAIALLLISEFIFWLFSSNFWGIMAALVIFFTGFNILEASLPSIISKLAPQQNKGATMGVYSTAQFLGPMVGGVLAGVLFKYFGLTSIFILGLCWAAVWLALAIYANTKMQKNDVIKL